MSYIYKFSSDFDGDVMDKYVWGERKKKLGVGLWPMPQPGGITIAGIWYSEHALGRRAPLGNIYTATTGEVILGRGIPPSVVQNVLKYGKKAYDKTEL